MPRGSNLFVTFGIRPRRSSSLTPMYSNKTINKNKVRSEGIAMARGISLPIGRWGGPARDLLPNTSVPFS